jgi:CRISP-associated protein Cas1
MIIAKIANSRVLLLRSAREIADDARQLNILEAGARFAWTGLQAAHAISIGDARGHEGSAGQTYFSAFDVLGLRFDDRW